MADKPIENQAVPRTGGTDEASVDPAAQTVRVGDVAPPFTLPDTEGNLVSLSDLTRSGQTVVVFYRGHW